MKVVLVGLNHRTAPVQVRERFAVSRDGTAALNEKLVQGPELSEGAILSTCNRTELFGVAEDPERGLEQLRDFLAGEIGEGTLDPRHLYRLREEDAVLHLFRVAASLDSMVLGETQILGQVKDAYRAAVAARSCGAVLNRLFQHAFHAAKRVRTETGLGASAVSVARIAVQLARELFESFEGKELLLLGAGEMAESGLEGFREAGIRNVVVANRSPEAAHRLAARVGGRPVPLGEFERELALADVVLCSVDVSMPIVERAVIERALQGRHGRPLLLIDLGLPRNVEIEANDLENAYLYDLDDLEGVAAQGRERRRGAAKAAEAILSEESEHFERWRATLPLVPTIQKLVETAEAAAREEVCRALAHLEGANPDAEAHLQRLGESIVHKVLHRPLVRLREAASRGTGIYYAEAVQRLFGLEEEEE